MIAADVERLSAPEIQAAIALVLKKAKSQHDAEKGALAAALSVTVATHGPVAAVERLRDLADVIERDIILPRGGLMQ